MTTIEVADNLRPFFKLTKGNKPDRQILNKLHLKELIKWDYVDFKNYHYLIEKYGQ